MGGERKKKKEDSAHSFPILHEFLFFRTQGLIDRIASHSLLRGERA